MIQLYRKFALACVAILGATSAPVRADGAAALSAFEAAIRSQYDMREKAFNSKDLQTIVDNFYSADVVSVPPGDDLVIGRQQLLEAYKAHSAMKIHISSYKSHVNGNNGIDWANFYYTPDDPKLESGVLKMIFLWEKRHGKWVCIGDMFVTGKYPSAAAKSSAAR